jgi:hypothetical protein
MRRRGQWERSGAGGSNWSGPWQRAAHRGDEGDVGEQRGAGAVGWVRGLAELR